MNEKTERERRYHELMRPRYQASTETLAAEAKLGTVGRDCDGCGESNSVTGGQDFQEQTIQDPSLEMTVAQAQGRIARRERDELAAGRPGDNPRTQGTAEDAVDEANLGPVSEAYITSFRETLDIINVKRAILPSDPLARKEIPVATGFIDFFPDAIAAVAALSKVGNDQHNPGKPLHWDRSKSGDEADTLMRHFLDRGTYDTDGVRHSTKVAWRALALLQKELEAARQ